MSQMVDLEYKSVMSPVYARFGRQMSEGRIVGQKCPSCGLVFLPPRGFCSICSVVMDETHEVEVKDQGTITSFTVITPIQYPGQEETEDYVLASVLLDGADQTMGQQRTTGIPNDQVRTGMRVKAVWSSPDEAKEDDSGGARGYGLGASIQGWEPSGEPDVPRDEFKDHVL
jgi:uncharacterized protein